MMLVIYLVMLLLVSYLTVYSLEFVWDAVWSQSPLILTLFVAVVLVVGATYLIGRWDDD